MTTPNTIHDPRYDDSQYQYAGFWVRFAATMIDCLLVFAIILVVSLAMMAFSPSAMLDNPSLADDSGLVYFDLISNLAITALVIWFWLKKAATPGKMLFDLQILDAKTGQKIKLSQALLRYFIGYTVSGIVLGLGYIWAGFDAKKQGWHDKIASTVVVKRIR
ncbi:RDD family protein [Moraxella marmotae]|uniref:RDD family protein n=1 Tax=Moraxella marmotae TaxID=3344520 RepID=UPI0035F4837F